MGIWDYFTSEQQEKMMKKTEQYTPEEIKQLSAEANEILAKLISGFEQGVPAESPEIVALAKRLAEKQALFMELDPDIAKAIERFHIENPDEKVHGMNLEIYRYVEKAKAHGCYGEEHRQ